VTKNGKDPLLSSEENCADLVQPPSALEVNHAITAKMRNLMVMMKAVKKFKDLIEKKRPDAFGEFEFLANASVISRFVMSTPCLLRKAMLTHVSLQPIL